MGSRYGLRGREEPVVAEIRITQAQRALDELQVQREAEIFVFDDESNAVLVRRWQRGDLAAASVAIQRHEAMVYAATFRLLRNHALSEDVSQDAFLRAHERIADLRQPASFPGWVRRIAVRLATDELRRQPSAELTDDEQIDLTARVALENPDETVDVLDCSECDARLTEHIRYLSLARLMTRDVRDPFGSPAAEAVRSIRRQSYRRRALNEIASLLISSPVKGRV